MESWSRQFNIYLALAAAAGLLCGCLTNRPHGQVSAVRVHLEANPDNATTTEQITVVRGDPVLVTISKQPILTEANLVAAKIIDAPGGFFIEIRFDETGTWILEQDTAANTGRHLAIFGQWGEKLANGRWLAAPLISHRIADGTLAFTPDMSRSEADQFMLGLSNTAAFYNNYNKQFK
jgi:hypothetical protein